MEQRNLEEISVGNHALTTARVMMGLSIRYLDYNNFIDALNKANSARVSLEVAKRNGVNVDEELKELSGLYGLIDSKRDSYISTS